MQWVQQLVLSKLLSNALQAMRCRQCGGILVANARAQRRVFAPVVPPSRVPSDSKPMPPPSTVRRRIIWNAAVLALVTLIGAVTHYSLGVVTRLEAHRPTAVASSTQRLGSLPASIASPPQAIAPSPFPPPTAPPHAAAEPCNPREHTELWGEVVQWGTPQPSAEACCAACREYEPTVDVLQGAQCNTWVWHPNTSACWLKNQKDLSSAPNTGTHVPWTAGGCPLPQPVSIIALPSHLVPRRSLDRPRTQRTPYRRRDPDDVLLTQAYGRARGHVWTVSCPRGSSAV
jgi:hypothetical protein